ncbi:methyltransferase domain-containing protein [Colletotrichum navitas]|uniref:Methyltransferase domain-containing protein n=1 Tax=Colletotrichum navitas TaxID=681940 RepID=A0AAD8PNF4_9PEZI|nr:methyltransferase domain-containing protein [Colletotrichum navitas]KAK1572766.1 methyltransferase domain-containing protein [Colletotrichum navitas]
MLTLSEISEVFWGLVGPWIFLSKSFYYLPPTILGLIRSADFATLLSPSRLQDVWFSAFWAWWGPRIRAGNSDRMVALLEGRVTGGSTVEDPVHPPVSGVVLEIGPGSGLWVSLFSKGGKKSEASQGAVRRRIAEGVSKVYGVEPNTDVHPVLRERVLEAGLDGTYEIVPTGIESLSDPTAWNGKIEKGSVDCIVSILCLCSIPEPEKNIPELYSYLKKGGRWYLYEHVKATHSWPIRLYQRFVNLVWPRALNGCQLCRDTGKTLRSAGPWADIDVSQPPIEPWYQIVPHIFGTFTK